VPDHSPPQDARLAAALAAVGRRLRLLRALRGAVLGIWVGLAVGLAWVLAGKLGLVGDPLPDAWMPWAAVLAASILAGAAVSSLRPLPGLEELALLLDRLLGTDEAAVTAVGLPSEDAPADLVEALQQRLDEGLDPADPRIAAGLRFVPPRRTRLLPILVVALVGALLLPPLVGPGRHAPSDDPAAEAERLVERRSALERELGAELPAEVDQAFDDLISALRAGEAGRERAEEEAEELERALDTMKKGSGEAVAGDMEKASEALQDVDVEAAEDVEDASKEGDLEAAAEAVERMRERMKKRPPQEQEKAADALKKAAEEAAEAGADELADALQNEADRAQGGESEPSGGGGEEDGTNPSPGLPGESPDAGGRPGEAPPQGGQEGGDGLAEYLRDLDAQGLGAALGDAKTNREMANRMQAALDGLGQNPYEAAEGQPEQGRGRGGGKGGGGWGAGTTHTDEDQGSRPEGDQHRVMNRQVDGLHRDWLTEYGQDHEAKRLEGIQAVTQTVDVPIGDGPVDVEFMRRTGSSERSAGSLVQAPEGYREAADEAIEGEGVPRIYREQVKTYFDAIE